MTVKGPFGAVHGSFSGLKASVPVKTVKTGIGKRDRDLCNESTWFEADKFPEIAFVSKKIEKTTGGFSASRDLTIKGVTKPVTVTLEVPVKK